MGYYSGNGVTTGGGTVVTPADSVADGSGAYVRERRTVTSTLVKNGVSLATAQAATPSESLAGARLESGSAYWNTPNASGRKVFYSYSQINGSNLYALVQTTETFQMRLSYASGFGTLTPGSWASLPS